MSMKLRIVSDDRDHAILVGDEDNNDISEFYHSDHATVSQSYETALALAKQLVAGCGDHAQRARPRAFLAWAVEMFGPVAKLRSERLLRFVEEAIELAHAEGMERNILVVMADRVYSRPIGETPKEIGQAQACLETFAENIGLSSADEAEREWQRVQGIPREEWTRRHSAKQALGIAITSTQEKSPFQCALTGGVCQYRTEPVQQVQDDK